MMCELVKGGKSVKDVIRNVVLIILFTVVIVLSIITFFRYHNDEIEIRYKAYDDDLIKINNQTSMEVQSNIVDQNSLAVLVSSLDTAAQVKLRVVFHDEDGKEIATKEDELNVLGNSKQLFSIEIPRLYEKFAGDIDIEVSQEEITNYDYVSSDNIKMEETHSVDADLLTNFAIYVTNNSNSNIGVFSGMIVLLKDDKTVGFSSFAQENFMAGATVSLPVSFDPEVVGSDFKAIDFDEVLLFPTITNDIS